MRRTGERTESVLMEILSKNLLELRKNKGLTRQAVADAIQISVRTYQRYENCEREPTASVLAALADFYDVSIDYLMGRTDKWETNR